VTEENALLPPEFLTVPYALATTALLRSNSRLHPLLAHLRRLAGPREAQMNSGGRISRLQFAIRPARSCSWIQGSGSLQRIRAGPQTNLQLLLGMVSILHDIFRKYKFELDFREHRILPIHA